ncbi:MAG: glycine zipper 2TM domain-containing protein [Burkholderiales bacterium]|nr:glycine zipper 2TM domain-containing protein [Burkholderiales bacterium]
MHAMMKLLTAIVALGCALDAAAQVTFFERDAFAGRSFTANAAIENFDRYGFHDRASSVVVRGGSWEACTDTRFGGRCAILQPGSYGSLGAMGLDSRVSSMRPVPVTAGVPPLPSTTGYDYRRRNNERTYEATVTAVHAVMGPPEQRCWMEQQAVQAPGSNMSIPGGIAGAIIGGVLGHQIGGGRGQDIATGVGAVGGAVVGANVGKNYGSGPRYGTQEVKRCENVASGRPAYWDVTYYFRGKYHRAQLTAPPGPTILVNGRGEPRV